MNRLTAFLFASLLLAGCGPSNTETGQTGVITDKAKSRIDSALNAMVANGDIAGVSAVIFEKDKEVYFNSFGYADREAKKPFDRNTIARIFSMTKPVTGVALMQLYEKGAFDLDDPLSKYLPEFADVKVFAGNDAKGKPTFEAPRRPITIRDITRHTAGFANGDHSSIGKMVQEADLSNPTSSLTEMASRLSKLPLAFHPGEQWSYGICVDVQAYLVEKLSGQSFDVYVRENILDPLKMSSTGYVIADTSKLAALYRKADDGNLERIPDSLANRFNMQEWPLKPGGWGLTSNIDDYLRFARMLQNEGSLDGATLLKPETIRLMATNHLADTIKERMWLPSKGQVGFGIDFAVRLRPPVDEAEKKGAVGEFFWDGAASTLFWIDPQNDLTAVLLVQILPFSNELHKNFREAIYKDVVKVVPAVASAQNSD